jgi:nitrogen fixation protein FixH
MRIPPHIAWPALVVVLLLAGITAAFAVMYASRSDGGPEIVENYYAEALAWNEHAAERTASERLGWALTYTVQGRASSESPVIVEFTLRDSLGEPVDHLSGEAHLRRPHRAVEAGIVALEEGHLPGVYFIRLPAGFPGLWDIGLDARDGTNRFLDTVRIEILP